MYPSLIFHSFNKNINSDEFYDVSITDYINLLDFLCKRIDSKKITLTFDDGFKSIIKAVEYALEKDFQTIIYIITDYVDKEGFLTRDDIKYLYKIGCIIGSHSKSHKNLTKIMYKDLDYELKESKEYLENIIGVKVKHFSFPYGSHNKYLISKVRKLYKFNAISRPNFFNEKNIVGRISINSMNIKKHENIYKLLTNKIEIKYLLRLILSFILKKIFPNKIYIFLKNIISKNKSKNIFFNK